MLTAWATADLSRALEAAYLAEVESARNDSEVGASASVADALDEPHEVDEYIAHSSEWHRMRRAR